MKLKNTYYILRHGEAMSNVRQICSSWPERFKNPLTQHGKEMILAAAEILKDKGINVIFSSDMLRTKQTAQIVGKELNIIPKFDKRLREVGFGNLNGRPAEELLYLSFEKKRLNHSFKRSETYQGVLKRISDFLREADRQHDNKTILIISHQCPLWILENKVKGFSLLEGLKRTPQEKRIEKGEIRQLN